MIIRAFYYLMERHADNLGVLKCYFFQNSIPHSRGYNHWEQVIRQPIRNPSTYGKAPFNVAIINGGPGAPGSMVTVARELASDWGILEPLQTVTSLEGQVQELWELPGSVFPPGVEKTYDRFRQTYRRLR